MSKFRPTACGSEASASVSQSDVRAQIDHARYYASLGWQVFPVHSLRHGDSCTCGDAGCNRVAKHPMTPNGFKDATTDRATVERWWTENPDANIGIRTGEESGIWVLDLDVSGDEDGWAKLAELQGEHEEQIETACSVTGSGGMHLVFAWNAQRPVKSRVRVMEGTDTRGAGGYIIASPSMHKSGNRYAWVEGCDPSEVGINPAPDWLIEQVTRRNREEAPITNAQPLTFDGGQLEELNDALSFIPNEGRDDWLRVGMALHATGLGESAYSVWASWSATSAKYNAKDQRRVWRSFNASGVNPASVFQTAYQRGWQGPKRCDRESHSVTIDREALRQNGTSTNVKVMTAACKPMIAPARDAWYDKKPEELRHAADASYPFPIETAFPESIHWVRDFVKSVADSYQVPVDLPAMMVPPLGAVCGAKKYVIRVQPGWKENPALWSCVAMESGERKSAVFSEMLRPFVNWEREEGERVSGDLVRHRNKVESLRVRLKKAREIHAKKGDKACSVEMDEIGEQLWQADANTPTPPTVLTTETTTEGLAKLLVDNNERLLVAAPEADPLDVALGRYSRNPNLGLWLAGHAGDAYKTARITREGHTIQSPALSLNVAPQPGALKALFGDEQAQERGFIARFLFSLPTSMLGFRDLDSPDISPEGRAIWQSTVEQLLDIPFQKEPREIAMADDAAGTWRKFRLENESWVQPGGAKGLMRPWASKLPGAVARLAFALHVLGIPYGASQDKIPVETVSAALSWVPYLKSHVQALIGEVCEDPATVVAEKILDWAKEKQKHTFSRRDAFDKIRHRTSVRRVHEIDPALEALEDSGWIRAIHESRPGSKRGGRPRSIKFEVHPSLLGEVQ